MRFGITLPQFGPVVAPGLIADFARQAEDLGYQSLWVADRALAPLNPSQPYLGYGAEKPLPDAFGTFLDPLACWSRRPPSPAPRLGSSTLNATCYHPLLLGRMLTTLDQLTQGRLDAGFGIGWMQTEYEAVPGPDMVVTAMEFVREARALGYDGALADPQFAVGSPAGMTDCAGQLMAAYSAD